MKTPYIDYCFSPDKIDLHPSDIEFTNYLIKEIGVAVVPGSSFFSQSEAGRQFIRFCFSKTTETLDAARERLLKLQLTLHAAT